MKKIIKEQERNDGKRSFLMSDYSVIIYDPKLVSKKYFEKHTGISLIEKSKKELKFSDNMPMSKVYNMGEKKMTAKIKKEFRSVAWLITMVHKAELGNEYAIKIINLYNREEK